MFVSTLVTRPGGCPACVDGALAFVLVPLGVAAAAGRRGLSTNDGQRRRFLRGKMRPIDIWPTVRAKNERINATLVAPPSRPENWDTLVGKCARAPVIEPHATRHIHRILLVDDDRALRSAIRRALRITGHEIVEADTLASGAALLPTGFDLVLLDVRLPDGSGVDLAAIAAEMLPAPLVVALSGEATAQEAFALAQLGVVQFVSKPFSLDELLRAIEQVAVSDLRLEPIVKTCVGRQDLREVQDGVRNTMVHEALAMSGGNKTDAAKLLRVTRQAVQKFIRLGRGTTDEGNDSGDA